MGKRFSLVAGDTIRYDTSLVTVAVSRLSCVIRVFLGVKWRRGSGEKKKQSGQFEIIIRKHGTRNITSCDIRSCSETMNRLRTLRRLR